MDVYQILAFIFCVFQNSNKNWVNLQEKLVLAEVLFVDLHLQRLPASAVKWLYFKLNKISVVDSFPRLMHSCSLEVFGTATINTFNIKICIHSQACIPHYLKYFTLL